MVLSMNGGRKNRWQTRPPDPAETNDLAVATPHASLYDSYT